MKPSNFGKGEKIDFMIEFFSPNQQKENGVIPDLVREKAFNHKTCKVGLES